MNAAEGAPFVNHGLLRWEQGRASWLDTANKGVDAGRQPPKAVGFMFAGAGSLDPQLQRATPPFRAPRPPPPTCLEDASAHPVAHRTFLGGKKCPHPQGLSVGGRVSEAAGLMDTKVGMLGPISAG